MRVGTASVAGVHRPVVCHNGAWHPLAAPDGADLVSLLAGGDPLVAQGPALGDVDLRAPLRPPKIIAIGLNYLDHIREAGLPRPERPLVFTKFSTSVIGPNEPIVVDRMVTGRVDWEVELAAVIGRRATRVGVENALDHIFGYTVANDVTARDVQFGDGQWVRGKSLDTFCPLGPVVVTTDEIPDPQRLRLRTLVNGETVQDSNTSEMLFGVAELVAFCSTSFTLEPGDVLLTGTPWGCGEWMEPVRSLADGDTLETEIDSIGALRNTIVDRR
jgi:5-carboxymethyl-2-hydroxymuconate isomerase